jgi:flagellar protein FliO/FliZ
MRFKNYIFGAFLSLLNIPVLAAEAVAPSAGISMFKVLLGLAVVLGLLVGFAWLMKKMGVNQLHANAVARVVGGVSVGHRERVVVVEVANRWLVVGVSASQVTHLANLDPVPMIDSPQPAPAFGVWLQKALDSGKTK